MILNWLYSVFYSTTLGLVQLSDRLCYLDTQMPYSLSFHILSVYCLILCYRSSFSSPQTPFHIGSSLKQKTTAKHSSSNRMDFCQEKKEQLFRKNMSEDDPSWVELSETFETTDVYETLLFFVSVLFSLLTMLSKSIENLSLEHQCPQNDTSNAICLSNSLAYQLIRIDNTQSGH